MTVPHIQPNHDNSNGSLEQLFWSMKPLAQKVGIAPSRMGQLAKLCSDWENARQMLSAALKSKEPSAYLGAMIRSMKDDLKPSVAIRDEPEIAFHGRLNGWPVRKTALSNGQPGWWVAGVLYNAEGVDVGG